MPTPGEQDDRLLVEAAQADPARFVELYDRHFHRVYVYVLRRAGNRADAEDVTAEVFHRAFDRLKQFEWRGTPFVAWLFRIASNALADHWRRAGREPVPVGATPATDAGFDRTVMLFQLVDRLPAEQRRVIELRFGEGRSIQETAAAIDKSEGAVKQLQHRALEHLRTAMEAHRGATSCTIPRSPPSRASSRTIPMRGSGRGFAAAWTGELCRPRRYRRL